MSFKVVIPVVARNKGLDGYEHADGSPRARQVESIIAPVSQVHKSEASLI